MEARETDERAEAIAAAEDAARKKADADVAAATADKICQDGENAVKQIPDATEDKKARQNERSRQAEADRQAAAIRVEWEAKRTQRLLRKSRGGKRHTATRRVPYRAVHHGGVLATYRFRPERKKDDHQNRQVAEGNHQLRGTGAE